MTGNTEIKAYIHHFARGHILKENTRGVDPSMIPFLV